MTSTPDQPAGPKAGPQSAPTPDHGPATPRTTVRTILAALVRSGRTNAPGPTFGPDQESARATRTNVQRPDPVLLDGGPRTAPAIFIALGEWRCEVCERTAVAAPCAHCGLCPFCCGAAKRLMGIDQ